MTLLSAFNPHELPEARLRAVATGRHRELSVILDTVRQNLNGSTMQHIIVSAPRGFGKSFLMRHIELDCARMASDDELPLQAVLMPEEMPHVKEPETLLREIARTLVGGRGQDAELSWHDDDGEAWESAMQALDAAVAQRLGSSGMLVALVENFDVLLKRALPREEQRFRLRNWLTRPGTRIMLIAASASGAFDRSYDEPLFHAFRDVPLEPWSEDECLAYFDRQRADAEKPPLGALPSARARAVAAFIGGTPRLATLLGDALFDDDMLRAAELLTKLTDELTPYYKERIEALPGRSQKLLDALLRFGEPATQSELARRVKASGQAAIAGPFNDLIRERIVVGAKAPGSAEILYRVSDRIFAHYYRRRVIDHGKGRCPLESLVDLLAQYYSKDEKLARAEQFAQQGRHAEARVMARLHDADAGVDPRSRHWMLRNLARNIIPNWILPHASESLRASLEEIAALADQADGDGAYKLFEDSRWSELRGSDQILLTLVRSFLDAAAGVAGGLALARQAVTLASDPAYRDLLPKATCFEAWSLGASSRHQDAIDTATRALALAEQAGELREQSLALRIAAENFGQLKRHHSAVDMAIRAAALAEQANDPRGQSVALRHAAWSLGQLERHQEALDTATRAAALAEHAGDSRDQSIPLHYAAWSLGQLERHQEAIDTATRAAALAQQGGHSLDQSVALSYAAWSLSRLGLHQEAIDTATCAAALAEQAGSTRLQSIALRHAAWGFGQLERHEDAVDTASRAAALAEQAGELHEQSIALSVAAWNLGQLERHQEAIDAATRAAATAEREGDAFEQSIALRVAAWNLSQLERHQEAIDTANRAAALAEQVGNQAEFALAMSTAIRSLSKTGRFADAIRVLSRASRSRLKPELAILPLTSWDLGRRLGNHAQDIDVTHEWLTMLASEVGKDALPSWASAIIGSAVDAWLRISDAHRLSAIIDALVLHLGERAVALSESLRAARDYHAAGRDPSALARVDPDIAKTLLTLHPPAQVEVKRRRAKTRSTSRKR